MSKPKTAQRQHVAEARVLLVEAKQHEHSGNAPNVPDLQKAFDALWLAVECLCDKLER